MNDRKNLKIEEQEEDNDEELMERNLNEMYN